jgi:hypothetical protein
MAACCFWVDSRGKLLAQEHTRHLLHGLSLRFDPVHLEHKVSHLESAAFSYERQGTRSEGKMARVNNKEQHVIRREDKFFGRRHTGCAPRDDGSD